jgi:hypothetical protein
VRSNPRWPAAAAFAALVAVPARAEAPPPPCAACLRWEIGADDARRLLERPEPLAGLELILRGEGAGALAAALSARGARVGRAQPIDRPPETAPSAPLDAWLLDLHGPAASDAGAAALRVKALSTDLRSREPLAAIGLDAAPETLAALWSHGVAPYVDFVVGPAAPPGIARWSRLGGSETATIERALAASRLEAERLLAPWPADPENALGLRALRDALPAGLSPLPEVSLSCDASGPGATEACAQEVFLHPRTLEAVALVHPRPGTGTIWVRPGATAAWWHSLAGEAAPREAVVTAASSAARLDLVPTGAPFLLRIAGWAGERGRFAAGLEVLEEKTLTVEEVIARHQAAAARQRRLAARHIAQGTTVLTFQAPGLAAPVTVTADTVLYASGEEIEIEQRSLRLNGVAVAVGKDGVPRLPIVEPERVTRPPMAIALDEAYEYRLAGRETVGGEEAYVVAFVPREGSRPRFRGRAWIAARGFALLRVDAAQTGLRGPIVSSQQSDEFVRVPVGDESVWLLARSQVDQVYEGAGHQTPIQRVLTLAGHEPDPPGFEERRRAAHASASVMLRDTPEGYRYLRRPADGFPDPGPDVPVARSVATGGRSRVRTLAAGALVDPNITTPLPFAGLSYLDFDFLGTGAQVNAFFAAAFLQAAVAVPSLGGSRWQLHGSAFATVAEYNDRVFHGGVERYGENLRQRPARLALALVRPLSPRLRARAGYELSYTRLRRSEMTDADFLAPPSPLVHALRLSLEGQRGPWTASVWWSPARRQGWRAWGPRDGAEARPEHADFQRFGASLARSFVLSPEALLRLEGAWMAGTDLDRFSRFGFDAFENRLRGYPSAGLRFDRGAVVRTVATWAAAPGVRLDAFADTALVRDPGFGSGLRSYSGVGAGVEAPLPWRTLLAAEWGYGFQGRDRTGAPGTHVFRVTAYKVF